MMRDLKDFPETMRGQMCELRRVEPNVNNARILLDIVESSRQSLGDWLTTFTNITTREGMEELIKKRNGQWKTAHGFCYGLYANNLLVGRVRAYNFDFPMQTARIEYWIADEFVGRGLVTDAVRVLSANLFDFGFERIELYIDAGNTRAENVAKRAGFVFEGRMRRKSCARGAGGVCDLLIYAKLKGDC